MGVRHWALIAAASGLLMCAPAPSPASDVPAEATAAEVVSGTPDVTGTVADPDYAIEREALGLRREVQMWQWDRDGEGFAGRWSGSTIDSSDFPPQHANPGEPPYADGQWWAGQVQLQGRRLGPDLLTTLEGWQPIPASEAVAALPPNLAVVFQPDGDWLSSSADPARPDIGDLRVRWWQLPNGPVHGELVADGTRWAAASAGGALMRGELGTEADDAARDPIPGLPGRERGGVMGILAWVLLGILLVGGFVLVRRQQR